MAYDAVPPPPPSTGSPGGPGWDGDQAAPSAQPPGKPTRPRTGRIVLFVVAGLLVVVGGCTALLYVGGTRLVGSMRAPVDRANAFLDAVRVDEAGAHDHVCPGSFALDQELGGSEAQNLHTVHVSDNQVATVSGSVTLEGGRESPLTVELRRVDDEWCVASTRFEAPPDPG